MPPLEGLRVVLSPIHGYGVIALRPFAKGDIVCWGDGVVYRETDEFDDTYALILTVGSTPQTPIPLLYDLADQTRWINHSCDPNTEVDASWDPETETAKAWWTALRDIEPGEELFYDYAFTAELAEPCACGAATCRGLIIDADELADPDRIPERLRGLLRRQPDRRTA